METVYFPSVDFLSNDSEQRSRYRRLDEYTELCLEYKVFLFIENSKFRGFTTMRIQIENEFGKLGRFKVIEFINHRYIKENHCGLMSETNVTLTAKGRAYWREVKHILNSEYSANIP